MLHPLSEEKTAELRELLFRGRKIDAIKLYREATGSGLKDSKEAVEAFEESLRQESPERFQKLAQGKGCFGAAVALCLAIVLIICWMVRS